MRVFSKTLVCFEEVNQMNHNERLNQLLDYGLKHQLFEAQDLDYMIDKLTKQLNIIDIKRQDVEEDSIINILNELSAEPHQRTGKQSRAHTGGT